MLRMLSMSAQDTLGSITGRAAAAEWAHQQARRLQLSMSDCCICYLCPITSMVDARVPDVTCLLVFRDALLTGLRWKAGCKCVMFRLALAKVVAYNSHVTTGGGRSGVGDAVGAGAAGRPDDAPGSRRALRRRDAALQGANGDPVTDAPVACFMGEAYGMLGQWLSPVACTDCRGSRHNVCC